MAIHQLFEEEFTETFEKVESASKKGNFFSTLVTRLCFLLLLVADAAWLVFNIVLLTLSLVFLALSGGKSFRAAKMRAKYWRGLIRSAVCALALFTGLFCPPFGIMVACTYFLMYDKGGMEEVVPAPLQEQFKDIFHTDPHDI